MCVSTKKRIKFVDKLIKVTLKDEKGGEYDCSIEHLEQDAMGECLTFILGFKDFVAKEELADKRTDSVLKVVKPDIIEEV